MFGLKKPEMKKHIELDRKLQEMNGGDSYIFMSLNPNGDRGYYLQFDERGSALLDSKGETKSFKNIESALKVASEIGANQIRINCF